MCCSSDALSLDPIHKHHSQREAIVSFCHFQLGLLSFSTATVSEPHWFEVFAMFCCLFFNFLDSSPAFQYLCCSGLLTKNPPPSFSPLSATSCLHLDHPHSQTCILVLFQLTFTPNFQPTPFPGYTANPLKFPLMLMLTVIILKMVSSATVDKIYNQ